MNQVNSSKQENRAPESAGGADEPRLGDDSQSFIGLRLRELYDNVVSEPVPDRLVELLKKLEEDDGKSN
ncbi:NepR family anti-sigma factor [Pelagibacterium montanilacus]|uniref:NepR family anti-sigma factor n=1 Tax=Pelagibacterium montanilacus TaxID=2185280 RepID=UPI000F8DCD30|nr:NepR family anti-sigma factor [Pelagibacterium montanilacus]